MICSYFYSTINNIISYNDDDDIIISASAQEPKRNLYMFYEAPQVGTPPGPRFLFFFTGTTAAFFLANSIYFLCR